ncbi:MAG TPA: hypothetical protein VFY04_06145 [Solirubrobacterales bacterium]|nr:hypothetical protein [Solirubrobacterales bacterium]
MLLEMSDEEIALLEQLNEATEHIRAEGGTREQKRAKISALLDQNLELRNAFRALTGREGLENIT